MAETESIVITNVDARLLERQKKLLHSVIGKVAMEDSPLTYREIEALEGIVNMLDDWSDNRGKAK